MTKYSKLFGFILFSLITIVGFVIYESQAKFVFSELTIVTENGTEAALKPLNFSGYANNEEESYYSVDSTFEYTGNQLDYLEDRSILQQIDSTSNLQIDHYIQEYRSFMRGKSNSADSFTETDDHLIYTALRSDVNWRLFNDNYMSLSLLDKDSNEEIEYEVYLDGGNHYSIVAAYSDYPTLTIVTQSAQDQQNQWLIYSFDFNNPEEELQPVANITYSIDTDSENVQIGSSPTKNGRYILFRALEATKLDETQYVMEYDISRYYVYDIQSNDTKEISAFDTGETIVLTDSDKIIVGNVQNGDAEWFEWDFENESFNESGNTSLASPTIGRLEDDFYVYSFNRNNYLVDDSIYMYEEKYTGEYIRPHFQIIDIDSFETTFNGYVAFDTDQDPRYSYIYLNDLSFSTEIQ